ncbi:MAG: hypothetical protein QF475_00535, partial [Candidatus Undinarchaeales archaeon]|nr:hypothetical protein [Candidatus Undinarchaeales archaeon]
MHKKEYEQKEIGKNENFNNEVESFCKEKVKFIIDLHTSQGSQKEYSKRKEPYIELINPLKLDKNERIQEFIKKLKEKELIVKDMAPPCFIPKNDWIMEIWLPSKEEIHNGLFHTLYYADQVKLWSNHLNEIIEKSKEVIGELVPFLNNFYGDNPELCKEMATIHYKSRIFE